ncbi:MAG: YceI family protein [Chitinophagales bacterium]|nr:YceI family protein [Chitinophagales bacterium]
MKTIVAIVCAVMVAASVVAQTDKYANTYSCSNGSISFFSTTPIENIEAESSKAVCVLNTQTKKVYAKVAMTTFSFTKKLMQEHFNENYMESEKYPYGILDAVIAEDLDFTADGTYDVTLKGTFEVHGVKQERDIKGKLTIKNGQPYQAVSSFVVKLSDHKIKIPKAVVLSLAEEIKVNVDFIFQKYVKN